MAPYSLFSSPRFRPEASTRGSPHPHLYEVRHSAVKSVALRHHRADFCQFGNILSEICRISQIYISLQRSNPRRCLPRRGRRRSGGLVQRHYFDKSVYLTLRSSSFRNFATSPKLSDGIEAAIDAHGYAVPARPGFAVDAMPERALHTYRRGGLRCPFFQIGQCEGLGMWERTADTESHAFYYPITTQTKCNGIRDSRRCPHVTLC